MAIIFDIETDGFLDELTKMHCNMMWDTKLEKSGKDPHLRFDPKNQPVDDSPQVLMDEKVIVGHNIIGFDIPALEKLYPDFKLTPEHKVIDTYVWAACAWPGIEATDWKLYHKGIMPASLIGKHTIEAYGYRLGIRKGEFAKETDWQVWTPKMSEYCEQDVNVNAALYHKLKAKAPAWEQVVLEHDVRWILERQMQHGVLFNTEAAAQLYESLSAEREKLRAKLTKHFPPFYKRKGKKFTPKRDMRKRAGEWVGYVAGAEMQKIELVEFNPASSQHVARMLLQKFDWFPTEFAEKEQAPKEILYHYERLGIPEARMPKIDDEIVKRLPFEEIQPLGDFLTLNKRCGQLSEGKQGWLKAVDPDSSRIHGVVNQFGAVTGRCTHFRPNLAQVPASYSPYGPECRELFTIPAGYVLVGCDADGLEARCKAHYITKHDGGAFIKVIMEGKKANGTDIHSLNKGRLVLASRDVSKTWYYAFMYGAGDVKLGAIALTDDNYADESPLEADLKKLGKHLRSTMEKEFPGLEELIKKTKKWAKKYGWLPGLDGRRIPVRHQHAALNTLLQSAGAVVMKKALVLADKAMLADGMVPFGHGGDDYEWVLNVHDEYQNEVKEKYAELAGGHMADAIRLAGEHFKFRCPLSGSYDIGSSWKETH